MNAQERETPDVPDGGLDRAGGLRRLHAAIVIGSLPLTLGAWTVSRHALEQRNRARFDRSVDAVVEALDETLERHAGLLRAAAGFVESGGDGARAPWRAFTDALDLPARYPALGGLAAVRRVPREAMASFVAERGLAELGFELRPAHGEPFHLPIVMVAAEGDAARTMLGYDLAFSRERRRAVDSAFAADAVRLTAPVHPARGEAAGAIMVAPYRGPATGPDVPDFAGVVATSMLFERLFDGALAPARRQVRLTIRDGRATVLDEPADASDPEVDPAPLLADERALDAHGRSWRIRLETTRGFREAADVSTPWVVLGSGLVIDALLVALLWLHQRAGRRLVVAARRLAEERGALARSNERLEAFACVVSHDLKAPLAGIGLLVDAIEEDLEDGSPKDELLETLGRVRRKVRRADALVEGVLDYSGLGEREERVAAVEVRALVADVGESLDLAPGALVVEGEAVTVETSETRLRQVLANLVGNAFKYHDAPGRARVRVAIERLADGPDGGLRITVADDGPGIDPRYRERVFEPFARAHEGERADSTGVGLAIVRKSVEAMGGAIALEDGAGRGATFAFTWPARVHDRPPGMPETGGPAGDGTDGTGWPVAA